MFAVPAKDTINSACLGNLAHYGPPQQPRSFTTQEENSFLSRRNAPLDTGLVTDLARPGGSVTGLSNQAFDIAGKRLEILSEAVPGLRRLAIRPIPEVQSLCWRWARLGQPTSS